jgi:hypothetical protein
MNNSSFGMTGNCLPANARCQERHQIRTHDRVVSEKTATAKWGRHWWKFFGTDDGWMDGSMGGSILGCKDVGVCMHICVFLSRQPHRQSTWTSGRRCNLTSWCTTTRSQNVVSKQTMHAKPMLEPKEKASAEKATRPAGQSHERAHVRSPA